MGRGCLSQCLTSRALDSSPIGTCGCEVFGSLKASSSSADSTTLFWVSNLCNSSFNAATRAMPVASGFCLDNFLRSARSWLLEAEIALNLPIAKGNKFG
jgi:hypothetical protein